MICLLGVDLVADSALCLTVRVFGNVWMVAIVWIHWFTPCSGIPVFLRYFLLDFFGHHPILIALETRRPLPIYRSGFLAAAVGTLGRRVFFVLLFSSVGCRIVVTHCLDGHRLVDL